MTDARIGHATMTELRLRHADLEAAAQRLRDRAEGMVPTTHSCAATMRRIRATQTRADEYARLLRMLTGPTLDEMERDAVAALTTTGFGEVRAEILEPGMVQARDTMGHLFDHWRSRR